MKEKKKISAKKKLACLAMGGVLLTSPIMLTGCEDGKDGTVIKSGESYTEFTDAKIGDFFIDTNDYILYTKTALGWEIVMENYGRPGTDGEKGETGEQGSKGDTGAEANNIEMQVDDGNIQWRYKTGDDLTWKTLIEVSKLKGDDGANGATPYVGANGNWFIGETDLNIPATGTAGEDGKAIEIQKTDTAIQWRYVGSDTWTDLVALSTLKGSDGDKGADGKSVEIAINDGNIQWRYVGDSNEWQTLISTASLKGVSGNDGVTPHIGANGNWYIGETDTKTKASGTDGREVELQAGSEYIQWRYKGAESWANLIAISALKGLDGATWFTGDEVSATNSTTSVANAKNGDLYLNTSTYDIFKNNNGTWEKVGNIKGADGAKGEPGATGVGIKSVEKTGTSDLVDTYTITYTDSTTSTFTVTNGAKGDKGDAGATGNGIASIVVDETNTDTSKTVLKITFTNNSTQLINVANGKNGENGVGITSISKTSTNGLVDTYTITYSSGDPTTFTVTNGKDGATWITGTAVTGTAESNTATVENAKVGDLYFNTSTCDLYTCVSENTWKWLCNIKGADGAKGDTGVTGDKGEQGTSIRYGTTTPSDSLGNNGDMYINTSNWYMYAKENGTWNYKGCIKGDKGDKGTDGASTADALVYTGFDGYVWQGKNRTSIKAEQTGTVDENIRENTLTIRGTMSTYYPGEYLDLTTNQIAIMSSYFPTIGKTQYSGTKISSITIYAEKAGELYIGTASVADVINAKKNSSTSITSSTTAYTVVAGENEVVLNLQIGDNETLVIGGNDSVGIYYATGIPVSDTLGGYAYINGEYNADIIQMTNGYNDTLAIEIKVGAWSESSEVEYIDNLSGSLTDGVNGFNAIKGGAESYGMIMAEGKNIANGEMPGYSGKTLSKIGFIFANKFSDVSSGTVVTTDVTDKDAWAYAYVVKKSVFTGNQRASENYESMYKLTFANFTPNTSTENHGQTTKSSSLVAIAKNPWSYTTSIEIYNNQTGDYSAVSGIEIGSDELIAFAVGNCNFMLVTNYSGATDLMASSAYDKYGDQLNYWYHESGKWTKSNQCAFPVDMYYVGDGATVSFEENYKKLEAEEAEAIEMNKAEQVKNAYTNGKTISFLGDSLTAYAGWSDNASYNTTLDGYDTDNDNENDVEANYNSYGSGFLTSSGITSVDQTWWKQSADDMGMTVLVNNSSSGSKATQTTQDGGTAKSGIDRCTQLHNDTGSTAVNPDIIAVYLGINDMLDTSVTVADFKTAYTTIISTIKTKYTTSDIVVFTLPYIKLINGQTTGFVDVERLTAFNNAIKDVANTYSCTVVDVYPDYSWTADNWTEYCITNVEDGLGHPNAKGMDLITNAFIDTLYTKYVGTSST